MKGIKNKQKGQKGSYSRFGSTIKYLSEEQVKALLESVVGIRDKLIIKLLLDTGMRILEFSLLKAEHLRTKEGYIFIPAENTKTKRSRLVRVNRELMNDLIAYCRLNKIRNRYIWKGYKTTYPITTKALRLMIKKYGKKAGINWLTPHKLRHTHIVRALNNGVPLPAVQAQVGHLRLETTQVYAQFAPKEVKEAYERANL